MASSEWSTYPTAQREYMSLPKLPLAYAAPLPEQLGSFRVSILAAAAYDLMPLASVVETDLPPPGPMGEVSSIDIWLVSPDEPLAPPIPRSLSSGQSESSDLALEIGVGFRTIMHDDGISVCMALGEKAATIRSKIVEGTDGAVGEDRLRSTEQMPDFADTPEGIARFILVHSLIATANERIPPAYAELLRMQSSKLQKRRMDGIGICGGVATTGLTLANNLELVPYTLPVALAAGIGTVSLLAVLNSGYLKRANQRETAIAASAEAVGGSIVDTLDGLYCVPRFNHRSDEILNDDGPRTFGV